MEEQKEVIHQNKFKNFWKKFWFIVWKDNSVKGWIISIIFLFVVVKFIFFPLLNLATGTTLPLAIVESCSMYHQGNLFSNFGNWWNRHDSKYTGLNINKTQFEDYKLKNGFNKGDILFIVGAKPEKVKIGDIIIFQTERKNPIIHRVVNIRFNSETSAYTFSTEGDNNNGQLEEEKLIKENQVIGKAVFKLAPYLGWVKLVFFEPSKSPAERGFCNEN
ncbi:MAG: signal peptidase I [Nanoarchaeota archaeon]